MRNDFDTHLNCEAARKRFEKFPDAAVSGIIRGRGGVVGEEYVRRFK